MDFEVRALNISLTVALTFFTMKFKKCELIERSTYLPQGRRLCPRQSLTTFPAAS